VVLHVVWRHDIPAGISNRSGLVPTVALEASFPALPSRRTRNSNLNTCAGQAGRVKPLSDQLLERAGDDRFARKCRQFHQAMAPDGPGQVPVPGSDDGAGLFPEPAPFRRGSPAPAPRCLGTGPPGLPDPDYLVRQQALLLGTAGLLPSQRGAPVADDAGSTYIDRLEKEWVAYHPAPASGPVVWDLFRVRPGNRPLRRLVAMSYLLLRYRAAGLAAGVRQLVSQTSAVGHHLAADWKSPPAGTGRGTSISARLVTGLLRHYWGRPVPAIWCLMSCCPLPAPGTAV